MITFIVLLVVSCLITWFIYAAADYESHKTVGCDGTQKVTDVRAVGHRSTTTYVMYGDQGGVMDIGNSPVPVGSEQCFAPYTMYKGKRV